MVHHSHTINLLLLILSVCTFMGPANAENCANRFQNTGFINPMQKGESENAVMEWLLAAYNSGGRAGKG